MKKINKFLLVVSLVLCFISTIVAGGIQTDWGKVEMSEISIESDYGTLTGYIFKPKSVSKENKAPAVVCNHGFLNNREMQDEVYIELSRRGYVVISMESYGHGDSDVASPNAQSNDPLIKTDGMVAFVEYLYNLDYVDNSKIGVTGHSMGGQYSSETMYYYSTQEVNKINTGVIVGNYPTNILKQEGLHKYNCNVGVILAQYDEFFYNNGIGMLSSENTKTIVKNFNGETVESVEDGQVLTDGTYSLVFYNPKQFHATNHFSTEVTKYIIETFERTMPTNTSLDAENQVWLLKELFNLVGLIGFFLFIIPFLDLLLQLPLFKSLKKEVKVFDEPEDKKRWVKKNILNGVWCFLLTLPALGIGYLLLSNPVFPQHTTGAVSAWCVVCALFTLGLQKKFFGKKIKGNLEEFGCKISKKDFFKTLLLALLVVIGTYTLVFASDGLNQTDFRIWTFDIRVFNFSKMLVALRYLPFFGLFYIISSFAIARTTFKGWSETKQCLVTAAFNIITPTLFLFVCYFPTLFLGKIVWFWSSIGSALALMAVIMIPFVPILAISSIISTKAYRMTGNMWLGGLINTLLITMITVANTSFAFAYIL